jgi:hypothetical protein
MEPSHGRRGVTLLLRERRVFSALELDGERVEGEGICDVHVGIVPGLFGAEYVDKPPLGDDVLHSRIAR